MSMTLMLIYCSAFPFVCGLVLFLVWLAGMDRKNIERRLNLVAETADSRDMIPDILKSEGLSDIPVLYRILKKSSYSHFFRKLLDSANLSMTVGHFILLILASAMLGLAFTAYLRNVFLTAASIGLFGSIPVFVVLRIRKKRIARFESAFPEVLDMMRNAIRSGFTIVRAIQLIGNEAPEPLKTEFMKTFEEMNLGMPFKDAFLHMIERIDSIDLKLFVTAVLIQRESGGNLNEILQKISTTVRARFKLAGQMRIYTAQGRLTQIVLGLLPVGFILVMFAVRPDYIKVLFQEQAGHSLLGIAFLLQLSGFIVIRKIIRIKLQ